MAICYECGETFYGEYCHCGWEAEYRCWNCKSLMKPSNSDHCKACGWFDCPECGQCGCDESRPLSNKEKLEGGERR